MSNIFQVYILILISIFLNSGYMSPEYAMYGQFSEKTDVFSFGVIILEIISAKKNARSLSSDDQEDLLAYVSICLS